MFEITKDANLISKDLDYCRVDDRGKSSRRERRKELKEIRKRKYGSQHKRKMLKMDGEGVNKDTHTDLFKLGTILY